MRKMHMTQKELAEKIGMNEDTLSAKICGRRKITLQQACVIATTIGMPVEELFIMEEDVE